MDDMDGWECFVCDPLSVVHVRTSFPNMSSESHQTSSDLYTGNTVAGSKEYIRRLSRHIDKLLHKYSFDTLPFGSNTILRLLNMFLSLNGTMESGSRCK